MNRPSSWTSHSYAVTGGDGSDRRGAWAGVAEPGTTLRLFPEPVVFPTPGGSLAGRVEVCRPSPAGPVTHGLAPPCGLPILPGIAPFSVGRLVSGRYELAADGGAYRVEA